MNLAHEVRRDIAPKDSIPVGGSFNMLLVYCTYLGDRALGNRMVDRCSRTTGYEADKAGLIPNST